MEGELEAILLSLKYIRTINLIGIKKVHIFTDSMYSIIDIIEEIKRISNELRTSNFSVTHVFSHIDIKFNKEADKLAKVGVKLARKYYQTKELTISTAKKANKNHSIEIWSVTWARQSHAKYKNIVPEINSASLKHCNLLQKITPAPFARKILQLKTGHNLLPANRCKIDKSIDPLCPTCKKHLMSITYFLVFMTWNYIKTNLLQMVRDTSIYYDEDITINLEVLLGELILLAEPSIIAHNFVLDYLNLIEKIDI